MMNPSRRYGISRLLLLVLVFCAIPVHSEIVEGSLEEAMLESRKDGKHLLIAFLGTGWSMSSDRFRERILQSPVFKQYAENELVLLQLEARRKPPLSKEEKKILHEWVAQLDIMTYPTLILLAPDGQEVFRHGYKELDAEAYVQLLQSIIPTTD
jgi:hypothetical protein